MSGKYLKARKLAREMEKKAEETAQLKEETKKKKEKVEELLEASSEIDIEVDVEIDEDELEEKIEKGKEKIEDKDFEEAEEEFDEVIEEIQKSNFAKLEKLLSPVKEFLDTAGKGSEHGALRERIEETKELIEEGEIKKGFEKANEIKDESEDIIDNEVSKELKEIKSLLKTASRSGKDFDQIKKTVSKANYAYEADEYERAVSLLSESREDLEEKLEGELDEMLKTLQARIKKFNKQGMDVSEAENIFEEAKECEEDEEFSEALKCIQEGHEKLDELFVEMLKENIEELKQEIEEAKEIDAPTEDVEEMLTEIEDLIEDEKHDKASGLLDKAFEEIREAKFNQVLNTIAESRDYFIKAKNIGADIDEPMEMLNKAKSSLEENNYKEALNWASNGREKVEDMVKDFEEAKSEIEERKEKMEKLTEIIELDLSEPEDILSKAETKLMSKEYDKALSLVDDFDEAFDKDASELIMENIDEVEKLTMVGDEIDIDMEDLSEKLEESAERTKSSDYIKGAEIVEEVENTAKDRLEDELEKTAQDIRESLKRLDKVEEDAKEKIQDILGKANNKLASERYKEASRLISEAEEELDLAQIGSAEKHLQNALDVVDSLEEMDIDKEELEIPRYRGGIKEAEDILEEEPYQAVESIDGLMEELNEKLEERTEQVFGVAKKETVQARKTGVMIEDLRERLIECKKKMKQGNHLEALRIAVNVKEEAINTREERKKAYENISDTASKVSRSKKEGKIENISEIKDQLVEAKEEFRDRNYTEAEEIAERASSMIEGLESKEAFEKKKEEVEEKIERVQGFEAGFEGVDALKDDIEDISETAEEEEDGYTRGVERLEDIEEELDTEMENTLENLFEDTKSSIESAEKLGMNTKKLRRDIKSAEDLKDKGDYWKSLGILKDCQNKIRGLQRRYEEAKNILENTRDKLQDAENIKAEVEEGKTVLEKAEEAFEKDRYDETIERAEEAEKKLEEAQRERVEKILEKFRNKVRSLRSEELDTALADNLIHKAEKAKERGDYKEAINYSMQSEGELEKIDLQQSISRKSISTAQEKLKEAEEKGLFVDNAKDELQEAKNSYQSGFYVKSFDEALKAGKEVNDALKAYQETNDFLDNIDVAINGLEPEGVDVDGLKSAKEEVENDFQNGDYVKAHSHIKEAEEILDENRQYLNEMISHIETQIEDKGEDGETAKILERARPVLDIGRPLKVIKLINNAKEVSGLNRIEKYKDTVEEVKNLVEKARKFGASVETVEDEIEEAEALEEDGKIDEALEKAEEALEKVEEALEPYSPQLEVEVSEELILDEWNSVDVVLKNVGNGFAEDIDVEIKGGELNGFEGRDKLRADEEIEFQAKIKPWKVEAEIVGKAVRVFDNKEINGECKLKVGVEKTSEGQKEEICDHCDEKIERRDKMLSCKSCGATFHHRCVEEKEKCPICSRELEVKEKKKEEKKEERKKRRLDMGIG
ncbi:MAG: hypothetical protein V5A88_04925 [Candidatus Thermoplasmatota archaeon]